MKAWPRNIDFTVVRRHAGVLPRWVGTTWVIQAMAQSRLSSAKEQSNSGYRNAESFVRSEHVRLLVCTRHLNDGLRSFEMSECPDARPHQQNTGSLCNRGPPGVGTSSNIDRERSVSETHKSGGTFRRRWQGQRAPVAQFWRPGQPWKGNTIPPRHACTARLHGEGEVELQGPITANTADYEAVASLHFPIDVLNA